MRNPALPKLLRAIATGDLAKSNKHDIIFNQAAIELEKLDSIEIVVQSVAASKEAVLEIINNNSR